MKRGISQMSQSRLFQCAVCLLVTGVASVLLHAAETARNTSEDQRVITSITPKDMERILADEGYGKVEITDPNRSGWFRIEGTKVGFIVTENNKGLTMVAGWGGTSTTLQQVNEWNRSKRYSRAYLDGDGDPVIEFDLYVAEGVTIAHIKEVVRTAKISLTAFHREVLSAGR